MMHKYHFIYKTTNLINGKYYIGVHNTNDLDDGYLGSGIALKSAIKKYGKSNFKREILIYFDSEDKAFDKESIIVDESFIKQRNNYNLRLGGTGGISQYSYKNINKVPVRDSEGTIYQIDKNDPRYLNGEVTHVTSGTVVVKDENGNNFRVKPDDPRYLNGELKHANRGKILVKNSNNEYFSVNPTDEDYLNGKLVPIATGNKRPKIRCPYCKVTGADINMKLNHFEYCSKNPNRIPKPKRVVNDFECPYCGKIGSGPSMGRWHFDNCKENPKNTKQFKYDEVVCPHCGTTGRGPNMKRYHFNNCKSVNNR